jgi:hypothetical protein
MSHIAKLKRSAYRMGFGSTTNIGIPRTREPQREVNEVSLSGQKEQLSAVTLYTLVVGE